MKKLLLLVCLLCLSGQGMASVSYGRIYYLLDSASRTATVTKNEMGYVGSIIIPENFVYDGTTYTVTSIGSQAFWNCGALTSVTIPQFRHEH